MDAADHRKGFGPDGDGKADWRLRPTGCRPGARRFGGGAIGRTTGRFGARSNLERRKSVGASASMRTAGPDRKGFGPEGTGKAP
jgi:hypothetical protein